MKDLLIDASLSALRVISGIVVVFVLCGSAFVLFGLMLR